MSSIEIIATDAVRDRIAHTDYLVPFINENDKEPSWDGSIYAYKHKGDNHPKSDLAGKVLVQIKGKRLQRRIKKKRPTYPVEISDLRNYLQEGGTVFFVVFIVNEDTLIYYNCLLPYDLKKILRNHSKQKKVNITLKRFPTNKNEVSDIILNFVHDRCKQRAAICGEEINMEALCKNKEAPKVSIGFTTVEREKYIDFPFDYLFSHESYLYANLSHGISLPVMHFSNIEQTKMKMDQAVSVEGKLFYSSIEVISQYELEKIFFGKNICLINDRNKNVSSLKFDLKGSLSERINDEEFLLSGMRTGKIEIGNITIPFDFQQGWMDNFNISEWNDHLEFLKDAKSVLDKLHVKKGLDYDALEERDILNLYALVSGIGKNNLVSLTDVGNAIGKYRVGNINLLIIVLKDEDSGLYRMYDYSDPSLAFKSLDEEGTEYPTTICVSLKAKELINFDNIDYDIIFKRIESIEYTKFFENQITLFMLEVIKAYDMIQLPLHPLLKFAERLNEYMANQGVKGNEVTIEINRLQIKKRMGTLSTKDKDSLMSIANNPSNDEMFITGAYILLDSHEEARAHYNTLSVVQKKVFDEYPISKFADWIE